MICLHSFHLLNSAFKCVLCTLVSIFLHFRKRAFSRIWALPYCQNWMSQLIYLHKSTEEDQHGAYIGKTITLEYLQFCVLISPQILDI